MLPTSDKYPQFDLTFSVGASVEWGTGIYCGDGAGGQLGAYPDLRRCGVRVVFLHQQLDQFCIALACGSPLPGEIRRLPAIYIVMLKVVQGSTVEYVGDNEHIIQLARDPEAAARSCHSDLFATINSLISSKRLTVVFLWIPSHTKTNPEKAAKLPPWACQHHIDGNDLADSIAVAESAKCQVELEVSRPYLRYYHLVGKMQLRYGAILIGTCMPETSHSTIGL